MRQILKRVTRRYPAGATLALAALIYLASCQPTTSVSPADQPTTDSTRIRLTDDPPPKPPKQPGGPGCCQ